MDILVISDILHEALYVTLKVGLPLICISLTIGVIISLIQALTQIQEQSLTFVPKIIAIFLSSILLMPYMTSTLTKFTKDLFIKITRLE